MSLVLAAHAAPVPLVDAPATALSPRTRPLLGPHASAAAAHQVSLLGAVARQWNARVAANIFVGGCTCEKATDGGFNPANEIDFTTTR